MELRTVSRLVVAGALLAVVVQPETIAEDACIPGGKAQTMPETASEYAAMCLPHVGVPPTVDCGAGVRIPIHVDGVEVFESPGYRQCDTPDFKGNCNVGSRISRVQGKAADGSPLEDVVWAWFCRSAGPELLEKGIASVQMIGHNKTTGATCFFESPDGKGDLIQGREYLHMDERGLLAGKLPGPDSPDFDKAFIPPPPGVQCAQCHQNNAFLHDPWIDGAKLPSDPSEPVLPGWVDPEAPYWVVGGTHWDLRTPYIEGNACLDCHRAPTRTASLLEAGKVHVNGFMPPRRPGSMEADYAALLACHNQGPANTPGCDWLIPPGGGCEARIVPGSADDLVGGIPTGGLPTTAALDADSGTCLEQCKERIAKFKENGEAISCEDLCGRQTDLGKDDRK